MSLNETPSADRLHIAFFGKRNAGKSSLMNAVTNQPMAIVSDTPGTTTDPVSKAMELLPLGPVLMIDTAGLDDTGELGSQRVHKSMQVMRKTDLAILVTNGAEPLDVIELALLEQLNSRSIPYVLVRNKCDLTDRRDGEGVFVSARTGEGIDALKQAMIQAVPREESPRLVGALLAPGDLVVLVIPIDEAAPSHGTGGNGRKIPLRPCHENGEGCQRHGFRGIPGHLTERLAVGDDDPGRRIQSA